MNHSARKPQQGRRPRYSHARSAAARTSRRQTRNKHAARAPQGLVCSGVSPEKAAEKEKETADTRAEKREKADRKAKRQQLRSLAGKHDSTVAVWRLVQPA
jgi:hypothetical protein